MSWFNRFTSSLILLTLASVGFQGVVLAEFNPPSLEANALNKDNDKLIKDLDLSPTQVQRLRAVRQEFKGQKQGLKNAIIAAERELANLMVNNAAEGQLQSKRQEINSLKQRLAEVRSRNSETVRSILNADQWTKLQVIRSQRRGK